MKKELEKQTQNSRIMDYLFEARWVFGIPLATSTWCIWHAFYGLFELYIFFFAAHLVSGMPFNIRNIFHWNVNKFVYHFLPGFGHLPKIKQKHIVASMTDENTNTNYKHRKFVSSHFCIFTYRAYTQRQRDTYTIFNIRCYKWNLVEYAIYNHVKEWVYCIAYKIE